MEVSRDTIRVFRRPKLPHALSLLKKSTTPTSNDGRKMHKRVSVDPCADMTYREIQNKVRQQRTSVKEIRLNSSRSQLCTWLNQFDPRVYTTPDSRETVFQDIFARPADIRLAVVQSYKNRVGRSIPENLIVTDMRADASIRYEFRRDEKIGVG